MKDDKIILFDCFGLFAGDALCGYFRRHFAPNWKHVKDHYCAQGDIGDISLDEMLKQLQNDHGTSPQDVIDEVRAHCHPNPKMIELALRMKEKHQVVLLSNCIEGVLEWIFSSTRFIECFDKQYRSYELHRIKPTKELYEYVLDDLGREHEMVFFDDNEENVKAANQYGLRAVLFESVEQCEEILAKLGY